MQTTPPRRWEAVHLNELIAAMQMGMSEKQAREIIRQKYNLIPNIDKSRLRAAMRAGGIPIRSLHLMDQDR